MILLRSIEAAHRRADMLVTGDLPVDADPGLRPLLTAAAGLGLQGIRLHDGAGSHRDVAVHDATSPSTVDPSRTIQEPEGADAPDEVWASLHAMLHEHHGQLANGQLIYDARFAHATATPRHIAAYTSLLLAGVGSVESRTLQFRLAMYEMCANIVEHGLLQRQPAEIRVHVSVSPHQVKGWIQDACAHFDLSAQPVGSLKEHAETRAARGYGIHMMHQLLQSIDHEFNETGNRFHFRKRITP